MSDKELSFLVQRKVKEELKKRIKEYVRTFMEHDNNYRTPEQWERIDAIIDREIDNGNHNIWNIWEAIDANDAYKS